MQVKKKMEEVEFCRNLRGVNDGKDFPKEFLSTIYHSISSGEQQECHSGMQLHRMQLLLWHSALCCSAEHLCSACSSTPRHGTE